MTCFSNTIELVKITTVVPVRTSDSQAQKFSRPLNCMFQTSINIATDNFYCQSWHLAYMLYSILIAPHAIAESNNYASSAFTEVIFNCLQCLCNFSCPSDPEHAPQTLTPLHEVLI